MSSYQSSQLQGQLPKGYAQGSLNNFSPEQMKLFQSLFPQVSPEGYTGRLASGDQSLFKEIEAPAMRQFSALQGNIASRFSGMGSGARNSSGFRNTMNQAASSFSQDLQSQRQGLQRQAIQDMFSMSNTLLNQRPQENFMVKKAKPWWQELLLGASDIGTQLAGNAFGIQGNHKLGKYLE